MDSHPVFTLEHYKNQGIPTNHEVLQIKVSAILEARKSITLTNEQSAMLVRKLPESLFVYDSEAKQFRLDMEEIRKLAASLALDGKMDDFT